MGVLGTVAGEDLNDPFYFSVHYKTLLGGHFDGRGFGQNSPPDELFIA